MKRAVLIFTALCGAAALAQSTAIRYVQDEGTKRPTQPTINFTGSAVSCTNDAASSRTTCDIGTAESWTNVSSFSNSWVNYDTSLYFGAGYYKDPTGVIHLRGLVKSGTVALDTTGTIFVLPSGYRPTKALHLSVTSNLAAGTCFIDTSGNVRAHAGDNTWFSLDGITFDTRS